MSVATRIGGRFKIELIGKLVAAVAGGFLTIVLARLLEPEGYGLLFLAISILGIIQIFSRLGIISSAAKFVSDYKETDPNQVRNIIFYSLIAVLNATAIVCFILLFTYNHISRLVNEPEVNQFLFVGIFFIIFSTLFKFVRKILQGFELIKVGGGLNAFHYILRVIFAIGLVLLGFGAVGALVGYILAFFVTATVGLGYIYVSLYRNFSKVKTETGLIRRILTYSIPLTATDTADAIDKQVDIVLVGFFTGSVQVAFYTISKQVIRFIEIPMSALGFTLAPTYETQKIKEGYGSAGRLYEEAFSYSLMLYLPGAAGLFLVADPFINIVFGADYFGAVPVLQILSIYAVFLSINRITSSGLDYLGRARERAIIKGITSILNIILNILLIPVLGVVGAAIATVFTYGLYVLANIYVMLDELELSIKNLINKTSTAIFITLIMSLAVTPLVTYITGVLTLFAVVGLGVSVWFLMMLWLGELDIEEILKLIREI